MNTNLSAFNKSLFSGLFFIIGCLLLVPLNAQEQKEPSPTQAILEAFAADAEGSLSRFRLALDPARNVLADQPYLAGATPAYADFILAGAFLWAQAVGRDDLLAPDDPIGPWLAAVTAMRPKR